jgi:hypothetical protein
VEELVNDIKEGNMGLRLLEKLVFMMPFHPLPPMLMADRQIVTMKCTARRAAGVLCAEK